MRELKFRCFYRGQMLQVEELTFYDDGSVYVSKAVHPEDDHIGIFPDSEHVKGVMQFTGLLDKNGKEIYEGDIVKMKGDMVGIVRWSEPLALFELITTIPIRGEEQYTATVYSKQNDEGWNLNREVIGNIHENPDLL